LLSDECHIGGCGAVNGSSENSVVCIGGSGEWFPSAACEGVVTLAAGPNAS
jgi:hypothetical protein